MKRAGFSFGFAVLLLAQGFCGCTPSSPGHGEPLRPGVLIEVPLPKSGPPLVPVEFKGKKYMLVLDTGTSGTCFDLSLRADLGVPKYTVKGLAPNGPYEFQAFAAPEANVGPISLHRLSCIGGVDMGEIRALPGDVRGILGMDVLKDYVVRLDFDRGRLSIEEPNKAMEPSPGEAVEIAFTDSGIPFVYARVMDRWDVKFQIDTGAIESGGLHRVYFESIQEANQPATMPTQYGSIGGDLDTALMRVRTVRVGSFSYQGLVMAKEDYFSRLGLGFLSRHNVVLDFPNRKIYLSKGRQFNRRDNGGDCGLFCKAVDGKFFVTAVDPEGPAAKAGIVAGDEILAWGGYATDHLADRMFGSDHEPAGRELTVTIRRGTQTKTVKFVVAKGI